jgi:predicted membrane channel-forming protein YqfA (hemolysin III family)
MYFDIKNYLKSNCYHTAKHVRNLSLLPKLDHGNIQVVIVNK